MADSNITKRALASSLKEIMETKPFLKISIIEICEKCEMNRKSFYYHFKDKYDLVNWIFYSEFITATKKKEFNSWWYLLDDMCSYFYENRTFYRKTLNLEGQNSFSEYFRNILVTIIYDDIERIYGKEESVDFYVDFYAYAIVSSIKRWLIQQDCISAEKFVFHLKKCLLKLFRKTLD